MESSLLEHALSRAYGVGHVEHQFKLSQNKTLKREQRSRMVKCFAKNNRPNLFEPPVSA
jgi:hypothetical protein